VRRVFKTWPVFQVEAEITGTRNPVYLINAHRVIGFHIIDKEFDDLAGGELRSLRCTLRILVRYLPVSATIPRSQI
jgi:hypothetical protein